MNFTKFFDVKSPISENTINNYNNAGIDVFFPRMSKEFLKALILQNIDIFGTLFYVNFKYTNINMDQIYNTKPLLVNEEGLKDMVYNKFVEWLEENYKNNLKSIIIGIYSIFSDEESQVRLYEYDFKTKESIIYQPIQIPLGLGFDIPKGMYLDLRSKSGNFKNGWFSITGLIDSCYTYGCGVQLIPMNKYKHVTIDEDEKISQIVMLENKEIFRLEEISLDEWNNNPIINNKRNKRIGGFGSTGKF
jgi:dUTPase